MKIRILSSIYVNGERHKHGDVIEVDSVEARHLCLGGQAEKYVEPKKPEGDGKGK